MVGIIYRFVAQGNTYRIIEYCFIFFLFIISDYHIVTVQLFPDSVEGEFVYAERWAIQFNGNSKYEVPIIFKGSAEDPKIIINEKFEVNFSPVHPECEEVMQVKIRNITRHCIE